MYAARHTPLLEDVNTVIRIRSFDHSVSPFTFAFERIRRTARQSSHPVQTVPTVERIRLVRNVSTLDQRGFVRCLFLRFFLLLQLRLLRLPLLLSRTVHFQEMRKGVVKLVAERNEEVQRRHDDNRDNEDHKEVVRRIVLLLHCSRVPFRYFKPG